MNQLEQAWRLWKSLSRPDRARFLAMLRDTYSQEREAVVRKNGDGQGIRAASLADLSLSEADFRSGGATGALTGTAARGRAACVNAGKPGLRSGKRASNAIA